MTERWIQATRRERRLETPTSEGLPLICAAPGRHTADADCRWWWMMNGWLLWLVMGEAGLVVVVVIKWCVRGLRAWTD